MCLLKIHVSSLLAPLRKMPGGETFVLRGRSVDIGRNSVSGFGLDWELMAGRGHGCWPC